MEEGFDILIGEKLGQFIAAPDRQHRSDGIEFSCAFFDQTWRFAAHVGSPFSS
jgi:hypothetical protein